MKQTYKFAILLFVMVLLLNIILIFPYPTTVSGFNTQKQAPEIIKINLGNTSNINQFAGRIKQASGPTIQENRTLTLDYSSIIRNGDTDVIRLSFDPDTQTSTPPNKAIVPSGVAENNQFDPKDNIFLTHNILVEARLDIPGANIRPGNIVSETLVTGQKINFYWSVYPYKDGHYEGTLWFYLRYLPKGSGVESRRAIMAQPVAFDVSSFFGLKTDVLRWFSVIGLVISFILGFPYLLKAPQKKLVAVSQEKETGHYVDERSDGR